MSNTAAYKKVLIIIFLLFSESVINIAKAQLSVEEKQANKYYDRFSYFKAIKRYESIKDLSVSGLRNLALCYQRTNQLEKSKEAFEKFINTSEVTAEDMFTYADVLRMNGKYDESLKWLDKFREAKPDDNRSKLYSRVSADLTTLPKDDGRYIINNLSINTGDQEFGTTYFLNQIVFASTRSGTNPIKRLYNWNEKPFLNIYVSDKSEEMVLANPKQLRKQINKSLHEGPAAFNSKGTIMAFTRNNYKEKSSDKSVKFQIYFSQKNEKGKWQKEEPFRLNNKEYNIGHPWISADGNQMYFSSDMPGGVGGSDIYRIVRNADGTWGNAINVGPEINTEADEMFPFYHEKADILFFSSNGHVGFGGLDIYMSQNLGNGEFRKVSNAGPPLNSRYDDFALIIDSALKYGFFSSNREGGKGDDDLYAFELRKPFRFDKIIAGVVKDTAGNILAETQVNLYNDSGRVIKTILTGEKGDYSFIVDPDLEFKIEGRKSKYKNAYSISSTKTKEDSVIVNLILERDPDIELVISVKNGETGIPIQGVNIVIKDNQTNNVLEDFITPSTGNIIKVLNDTKIGDSLSCSIEFSKQGYFTKLYSFNRLITNPDDARLEITMDKKVYDVSKVIRIDASRFDLNKVDIRPDAAVELNKVVKIMNEYPNMVIELRSYTDCTGSVKYNKWLSEARAKESAAYIKRAITNPERVFYKGFGETNLLNDCKCEDKVISKCSEEDHQLNRRIEFKVLSMDGLESLINSGVKKEPQKN